MSNRPHWDWKLSEEQVSKLSRDITKITNHWETTGDDTCENWIEFHYQSGKFKAPEGWDDLFEFNPDHLGLIRANYRGKKALESLRGIKAWERKNKKDREEYERLKAKFEGERNE